MSVHNKVNVVSAVPHSDELKRLISEGKDETAAGIFSSGHQSSGWISSGGRLAVLGTNKGSLYSTFSFGDDSNDPVDVTCVEELEVDCSKLTPLVLACTSSLRQDRLHVVNPANSRFLRTVDLGNLQVRCMTVVDDGRSSLNSLTEVLSQMNGVVALGCSNGAVILVDLNRELVIRAYREYWRRTEPSQPLKYVSEGVDEESKIAEIEEAQRCEASAAVTLIEGDDSDDDCGVTALSFSKETACLYVGYSSGLWQVWNLSDPNFPMLYECAECTNPVFNFCQIEPCEDPRPTVYLWVNHEGTATSMPLFNMYSLCYHNKVHVQDYGTYYQDFIACSISFSMYPGEEFANVISGKLVSAAPYSKTLKRALLQNMGLPEMEGIQMKLIITAFSLTFSRGSTHTYLCVFDLDQWYKEQMPIEPNCGDSSYIDTIELSAEPLLASAVKVDSVSIFHTEVPQEIHLVPQALSFNVIGLSETGLLQIEKIGLQKLWLKNTELIGAKSLIHPTKLFHACVSAGLMPTFPAQINSDINCPTNEEMRSFLLSVWLENGLEHVILEVAEQWENGAHAASNCTLNFLFDWVWSSISVTYNAVSSICEILFSASGHEIDLGVKRRLQHCRLLLIRLHLIQSAFCSKYGNPLYKGILETRFKAIDIIKLFVVQLTWFMNVGLLPEANSEGKPLSAVRYEYIKLDNYATERRQFHSNVSAKLKRAGKPFEMPGGSLYLVDHFLHDYPEIGRQWEEEGGSNAYPPPSVQSLLRTLRLQNVPTATKLSIVQYALLDIVETMDKAKHEDLIPKILKYHYILPEGHEKLHRVIQGLWHLDHGLHEEGLKYLLHRNITVSDLPERLHRAVVRVLFFDGKADLALQYLRLRNPRLTLPEDLKLEMSLLLAKKLTCEAYHFQKRHCYLRSDLLEQFFAESLSNGEISKVVNFPLDDKELEVFDDYLAKHVSQRNDDLRVLLRLTRKKYNEAKYLHDRLLALHPPEDPIKAENRSMIVNGLLSTIPRVSQLMFLTKQKGNYKTLPEFKNAKPRPLGLYPTGANGKPILNPTDEELCASAMAASANFCRNNPEFKIQEGVFDKEPKIYPAATVVSHCGGGFDGPVSRKRGLTLVSSANKRRRMDDMVDEAADDDISAFVGTPLVKRRSKELIDTSTPQSVKQSKVHSILKSNRTPGTPARTAGIASEDADTPKKTLRWDIPSESGLNIQSARKSLLSSSLSTPSKDESAPSKASAPETPQPSDSIKNRLRSHTATPTSVNRKGTANWSEIVEEVKPKVLFSTQLPPKKEKASNKPAKPVGPSFVEQLNVLISEEQKRKEPKEKLMAAGEFPNVDVPKQKIDEEEAMEVGTVNDDVIEKDTPQDENVDNSESLASGKHKFDDISLDSDELSILNVSSPFTTRTVPKQLREQLLSKLNQAAKRESVTASASDAEVPKSVPASASDAEVPKSEGVTKAKSVSVELEKEEDYESDVDEDVEDELEEEEDEDGLDDDNDGVVEIIDSSPPAKGSSPQAESSVTERPAERKEPIDIASEKQKPADEQEPIVAEGSEPDDGFLKISTVTSVAQDEASTSKPKADVLSAQPQIATKVVSLSRSPYPDDEDEVGSEDPEEAEIPPVMEFAQPEEGLLIDANYSLKGQLEESMGDSEDVDNDLRGLARIAGEESPEDSGSSVICLDSESDEEPKNATQLDFEAEDSYTFDSEEAGNSSRGRRSFFHDKYNTHQEESESPSPEYSSDEGPQEDVDLYNMDAIDQEDEDAMAKEVELEDEIFGLGRGLQRSKDDATSEDEDIDDEEEGEEEEEEEDLDEPPRGARVSDEDSESDDSDVQEISSEDEAPPPKVEPPPQKIENPKARLREMLKSASASGASASPKPDPKIKDQKVTVSKQAKVESEDVESTESSLSEPDTQKAKEDQAAVDALLGCEKGATEDIAVEGAKEHIATVEGAMEDTSAISENPEEVSKPVTPAKTTDVIDFNLSQGQMFFGTPPESETSDARSDRALFQWKTFSSKGESEDKVETGRKEEVESKSDEALCLRLEESDVEKHADEIPPSSTDLQVESNIVKPAEPEPIKEVAVGSEQMPHPASASSEHEPSATQHPVEPVSFDKESPQPTTSKHQVTDMEENGTQSAMPSTLHQAEDLSTATETVKECVAVESEVTESTESEEIPSKSETPSVAVEDAVETENGSAASTGKEVVSEAVVERVQTAIESASVTPEKSAALPKVESDMKSFTCQTSFTNTPAQNDTKSKSFSCQAAMDTTRSVLTSAASVPTEKIGEVCDQGVEIEKPKETPIWEIPDIVVHSPSGEEHSPVVIEPPTPFRTSRPVVEQEAPAQKATDVGVVHGDVTAPGTQGEDHVQAICGSPKRELPSELPTSPKAAELSGVGLLDDDEDDERLTIDEEPEESENPCEVAFLGDVSSASIPATPKTPMTPLRKSSRISRMATPGRALAPDDEVNVSDSVLDVAAMDIEVSDEKPAMVNRSIITDEHGEPAKKSRKSSKPAAGSVAAPKEKRELRSRSRSKSVDPDVVKSNVEIAERPPKSQTSRPSSSEPEVIEITREPRSKKAVSPKPEVQPKDAENDATSLRSSIHPEESEHPLVELRRSPRKSQSVKILSSESQEVRRSPRIESRRSSGSGSSVLSKVSERNRRNSSVEPESRVARQPSRRASSECPELSSQGSRGSSLYSEETASTRQSRKRRSSSHEASDSPPKLMRMGELPDVSEHEYRKRKIRHSITEPLAKKKHHSEEPRAGTSRGSEYGSEDSEQSRPRKKARSLHDYPIRKSGRPTMLESIEEVPEDSFGKRASAEDLTASTMRSRPSKPLDISKWVALSKSQVSKARRLAGKPDVPNSPVVEKQRCFAIDLPPSPDETTPVRESSPSSDSVVSVASTASSKVLRSGRTIVMDGSTPNRPRKSSAAAKMRAKKALTVSPRKNLRAARSIGEDDRTTVTSDSDDNDSSIVSSHRTSTSASVASCDPGQDVSIDELMSSRRLTRTQRSMLEQSRRGLSPVAESPKVTPKSKPRKKR